MLSSSGQTVSCPHCGKGTTLFVPQSISNSDQLETVKVLKSKSSLLKVVGSIVFVGIGLAYGYYIYLHNLTIISLNTDKLSTVQINKTEDTNKNEDAENASEELVEAAQQEDLIALMCACWVNAQNTNSDEIVKLLLNKGADVNISDNQGDTALILAASFGDENMVKFLLSKGADINAKLNDGTTALILATMNVAVENIKLLLASGVDINAKTSNGVTALSYAKSIQRDDIVQLLEQAGEEE
jgi:ankyrin repeat protein